MDEMDYRCDKGPKTGDAGQRYEVRATAREDSSLGKAGEQVVIGWTNAADGGGLARGARLWPAVKDVVVVDRRPNADNAH